MCKQSAQIEVDAGQRPAGLLIETLADIQQLVILVVDCQKHGQEEFAGWMPACVAARIGSDATMRVAHSGSGSGFTAVARNAVVGIRRKRELT